MHDKYRVRYRLAAASNRVRSQIALEAARRLFTALIPQGQDPPAGWLDGASARDFYLAKRKAVAVLGHRVRPGDLPSDSEVREQLVAIARGGNANRELGAAMPEPADDLAAASLTDLVDRFAIYKLRLLPLEAVKQNPKYHPEGDALYHSLQVFHLARDVRPYDEDFLLAALLHDVGKAIDSQNHARGAVEALRGAVSDRTLWLIEHHSDLTASRERSLSSHARRELESSEFFEDLKLLHELDDAGRGPGFTVDSVEDVLAYLRGLEEETYLEP
jgi:hypothetical protein